MLLSMCLGVKIKLEVDAKLPHQRRKNIILKRFTIIIEGENQNLFEDHRCEFMLRKGIEKPLIKNNSRV